MGKIKMCNGHMRVTKDRDVTCWRSGGDGAGEPPKLCSVDCAAFCIQDDHVYCLALPNAFIPAFAIGELVEDGEK